MQFRRGIPLQPIDLCQSPRVAGAHVEFTSACNLKCAYCAVSLPQYVPLDFEEGALDGAIDDLIKIGVPDVGVSGHGETTSLPNWQIHASKLIEADIRVNAISNLAKDYSRGELKTLAGFNVLVISIDTIDIDVFKRLRRGADLKKVLYNIGAVRAAALELGKQPPVFRWASVVCDLTVFDLPALVRYGLAMGIREFAFQNLVKMPEVKGSIDFEPLAVMGREELAKVPAIFDEIEALIAAHSGVCDIQPGLREAATLAEKVEGVSFKADKTTKYTVYRARKSNDGMTRDCIDPWSALYISSNGAVKPCCVMRENVGRVVRYGFETPDCACSGGQG